jgi:hypothetical protein
MFTERMSDGAETSANRPCPTALLLIDVINDASESEEENEYALNLMKKVVKSDITPSASLDLEALR